MKTIYAVERGCYSDYSVDALFSTREDAKLYRLAHGGDVVERILDPDMTEYRAGRKPYRVIMNRAGDSRDVCIVEGMARDEDNFNTADEWIFYLWATDKKHAVKISNERRTRHLAQGTWGVPTAKQRQEHERIRTLSEDFDRRRQHV